MAEPQDGSNGRIVAELTVTGKRRATQIGVTLLTAISVFTTPAAASHDSLPCSVPEDLTPLFDLLDTITQLAFLGGVGLGTIGLLVAALFMMLPGEDSTRRGKTIAKHVIIGTILLLSAQMIVSFLVSQLGTTVCT
jgi:hypothetical protein